MDVIFKNFVLQACSLRISRCQYLSATVVKTVVEIHQFLAISACSCNPNSFKNTVIVVFGIN